ncbi:uncharacterized protein SPSK_05195 [Sporothrix schenckii 1099-18]|uniref:BTB domain-containing protein n=1 Tax=Sporothrix schenckii 1099-18 TaxID=1397361 RepID=A0A0F2LUW2_SPOSC|nr:uncharacterized protein SPSK_05195 [Sporothrix schenckii 1099-18]KJR80629.1 hypothetical protein SPSK_05195 [Sporothrix schenckii 1099-18]
MQEITSRGSRKGPSGRNFWNSRGRGRKSNTWREAQGDGDAVTSVTSDPIKVDKANDEWTPNPNISPLRQPQPVQQQPDAQAVDSEFESTEGVLANNDQSRKRSADDERTQAGTQLAYHEMRRNEKLNHRRHYTTEGWNVKIVCNSVEWYLHKYILRKCHYFSAFLPVSELDDGSVSVIELHNHCAGQLANVLRFMYFFEYPGAEYDPRQPLYADSLLTNTAMYVAGASVGHRGMMQYAKKHIIKWSNAVLPGSTSMDESDGDNRMSASIPSRSESPLGLAVRSSGQMDYAILRLADPLLRSLTIVYEQPLTVRAGHLYNLRLVLVRFVAAALSFLAINEAFRAHFRNEWERPLSLPPSDDRPQGRTVIDDIVADYAMFSDLGRIGWQKVTLGGGVTAHVKKRWQPSLPRTFALLKRLSRNERSWTNNGLGSYKDNVDDDDDDNDGDDSNDDSKPEEQTVMPETDTKAESGSELWCESEALQKGQEKYLEASVLDHEKTMQELLQGLDSLLASEMFTS